MLLVHRMRYTVLHMETHIRLTTTLDLVEFIPVALLHCRTMFQIHSKHTQIVPLDVLLPISLEKLRFVQLLW
jgi:hypothetical protein